jgi:hypothetical protein
MTKVIEDLLHTEVFGEKVLPPQFKRKSDGRYQQVQGEKAPYAQLVDINGDPLFTQYNPAAVTLTGSIVVEQKTQVDAVTGTVTFSQNVKYLEIYNTDANQGVFNINGINITVPAGKSFKASIGGTPRATVTVTGSTSYILTRYE